VGVANLSGQDPGSDAGSVAADATDSGAGAGTSVSARLQGGRRDDVHAPAATHDCVSHGHGVHVVGGKRYTLAQLGKAGGTVWGVNFHVE
jgi:hypothetical protein